MTIRAVLFDLDNTLTHRARSISAFSQSLAQRFFSFLSVVNVDQITQIVHRIDNGGYPKKEFLTHPSIGASVAHALLEELDWIQKPEFDVLTNFWFDEFGNNAVEMLGAKQLLEELKKQNYKLAVVSNGGHQTRLNILKGLGFLAFFDEVISSELIGISKPNSEIFIETSKRLNVELNQCLFIGDHPVNDIQGANNVGMKAVLVEGFHQLDEQELASIPFRIKQLSEIWSYL